MAGLACADLLIRRGCEVSLFDKGRGPGGRMATRRMQTLAGEVAFDHGAQYFTARDPAFLEFVQALHRRGLVARWRDVNDEAWVGVPAMSAVIREMARAHAVEFGSLVKSIEVRSDGWHLHLGSRVAGPFDAVIVAVPAEQAATLLSLHDFDMARAALRARSKPCWTGMFAFREPVATALNVVRDKGIIAWAARNSAKPGREGPEAWVVQAQPSWSETHCEDDSESVAHALLTALGRELGEPLPPAVAATAHRWRFAMSNGTGDEALWNEEKRLGACGDWLMGPRVESAWLSGRALGQRIAESLASESLLRRRA